MSLRRVLFLSICILSSSLSAWAGTFALLDANGDSLGRLPYLDRGQERAIPLGVLADKAGWQTDQFDEKFVVMLPDWAVTLKQGNAFARVNDSFVQLRVTPEEWDGTTWVPAANLSNLFADRAVIGQDGASITVKALPRVTHSDGAVAWELGTIIIDAGHGGKDPGASGMYGLVEKTVTLDIARRLVRELESQRLKVVTTRTADTFLPLHERTSLANAQHGDLFISIHCNSLKSPDPHGIETYFLKPARTERAVDAAMRENEVVKLEDGNGSYQDLTEANFILLTMATSQYMKDSELWAALAQHEVSAGAGLLDRGVDQAGFYVLMGASMPAILFECGYLSNPDDAKLLSSERGRQKIAEGLSEAILKLKRALETSASR